MQRLKSARIAWSQSARGTGMSPLNLLEATSENTRYDFDLKTGKSETGLRACTYVVEVKSDPEDGVERVFMEEPDGGSNWRLIELRPVSEGT